MSRTEGVNVRAIPSPSPRYDRANEAQFRRALELSLERLNTRIQTVGLEDDETVLDPDADEEISGDWDFTGSPSLPESSITDGSILARLADNETVSGTWTFSGTPVVIGSDPGGDGALRLGGEISLHGADGNDIEIGPFENQTTGLSIRTAENVADDEVMFGVEASGGHTRFAITQNGGAWLRDGLVVGDEQLPADLGAEVVNVVHHGSGSPSAVGVEGTLHTQDA